MKKINNMTDFSNNNINNIDLIDPDAYKKYNNNIINELDLETDEFKKINKKAIYLANNDIKNILSSKCTINKNKINMTDIENETKINELIDIINNKFNLINKII